MNIEKAQDKWAQWLLLKRHGGDIEIQKTQMTLLGQIRDKVLQNAKVVAGQGTEKLATAYIWAQK